MMQNLRDFGRQTRCRVLHGHIMVNLGSTQSGVTLWMCARCHRCEALDKLVDDPAQRVLIQQIAPQCTDADTEELRKYLRQRFPAHVAP